MTGDVVQRLRAALDEREGRIRIDVPLGMTIRYFPDQLEALRTIEAHRQIVDRHNPVPGKCLATGEPADICERCYDLHPCIEVRTIAAIYLPDD